MKKNHTLTKQDSAALKGIAILLMIFHHCFLDPSRFAGHIVSFAPFSQSAIVSLSYFSKICVGIFACEKSYAVFCIFHKATTQRQSRLRLDGKPLN